MSTILRSLLSFHSPSIMAFNLFDFASTLPCATNDLYWKPARISKTGRVKGLDVMSGIVNMLRVEEMETIWGCVVLESCRKVAVVECANVRSCGREVS